MLIRFDLNDKTYDYDADRLPLFEARMVKSLTGLNAGAYLRGLGEMDHEALAAMVYLAKRRANEDVEWDELGFMDLMPLIQSIGDHRVSDEADEAVRHFEGRVEESAEAEAVVEAQELAPVSTVQPASAPAT